MEKKKILFVCLGNICRSPSAEAVFRELVRREGMDQSIECDSAGTASYHIGEPADQRMQSHAIRRGYKLTSIARKFKPEYDFDNFDCIVAMDDYNEADLRNMASDTDELNKIVKITDFCSKGDYESVPDPYYGGDDGFELVLDILEDACEGLLNEIEGGKIAQ